MEIDQDETNDETVPESVGEASVSSVAGIKRTKKHTSPVWNYFEKCAPESNLALCLVCGGKYQHPSTSVPSERLFSKAGEITSLKRNRLKSKAVDMMLFLNKL